jgi:hypothetical protein
MLLEATPPLSFPLPKVAWEFLHNNVYGDGEIERPTALPEFLTQQFKHDYHRHVRNLSHAS